jgi:hypothetical protein
VLLGQAQADLKVALLVQRIFGLRNLAELEAVATTGHGPEWIGRTWRDARGTCWSELDLAQLAADEQFLAVSA